FARRWFEKVHPAAYKQGGSRATAARQVKNKLVPAFGGIELKDITTERLQGYVATLQARGLGAKYIRNLVFTMSAMWNTARSWQYIASNPFEGLVVPACGKSKAEAYSEEEVLVILAAAPEPFQTYL